MEAEDFIAFLRVMGWSDAEALRRLGIGSHNTLAGYKKNGGPLWLGLACAALARSLKPWSRTFSFGVNIWLRASQYGIGLPDFIIVDEDEVLAIRTYLEESTGRVAETTMVPIHELTRLAAEWPGEDATRLRLALAGLEPISIAMVNVPAD